jgi:hypothetical protein
MQTSCEESCVGNTLSFLRPPGVDRFGVRDMTRANLGPANQPMDPFPLHSSFATSFARYGVQTCTNVPVSRANLLNERQCGKGLTWDAGVSPTPAFPEQLRPAHHEKTWPPFIADHI